MKELTLGEKAVIEARELLYKRRYHWFEGFVCTDTLRETRITEENFWKVVNQMAEDTVYYDG